MKRGLSTEARLLVLLEKNLAALERLTEVLTHLEKALPRAHHSATWGFSSGWSEASSPARSKGKGRRRSGG